MDLRHILFQTFSCIRGVYTSNFFYDLELYLGQILSLYVAKSLGQRLQIGCVDAAIEAQYLAQIKFQIGRVDEALSDLGFPFIVFQTGARNWLVPLYLL